MNPNQQMPSLPPLTPNPGLDPNAYDFIMNQGGGQAPYNPSAGGNSQKKRIIIVAVGVLLLVTVGAILMSFLSNAGKGDTERLLTVVKQQQELIRIAEMANEKAREPFTQSLSVITQLTLLSDQKKLQELAKKQGAKFDAAKLAKTKDAKNDELLTSADQNNRFDVVFTQLMYEKLAEHQKALEAIGRTLDIQKDKQTVEEIYNSVGLITETNPNRGTTDEDEDKEEEQLVNPNQ